MIQTPRSPQSQSDLTFYVVVAALWLIPGAVLVVATVLAGGAPHTHVVEWPFVAIRSLTQARGHPLPWQWVGAPRVRSSFDFYAAATIITVPLVVGLLLGLAILRGGIPAVFPFLATPPVRSRWATGRTVARSGLAAPPIGSRRLVLGRHGQRWVAPREGVSVLAFGASGSGKTASLCIPAVEEWDGPVVAVSDKPDLVEVAAGPRQYRGRVDVLDPLERTGLATCTLSPIEPRLSFDETVELVAPMVDGGTAVDEATRHVVTCALYCAANLGAGVSTAVQWLDDLSGETLVSGLLQVPNRDPRAISLLTRVVELGRDDRAACFSAARELLRTHFEQAARGLATPSFSPADFLAGDGATLFVVSPIDPALAAATLAPLVRSLLSEAGRRPMRKPLLLVLDGGGGAGAIEGLVEMMSGRGQPITVLATFNDLDQYRTHVGDAADAIIDRARAVVFLGGSADEGTLELMHSVVRRQLLGRRRGLRRRLVRDDDAQDLLPPDAGRQLGHARALVLTERVPPVVVWTRNCYQDEELQQRHLDHPFIRGVLRVHEGASERAVKPF